MFHFSIRLINFFLHKCDVVCAVCWIFAWVSSSFVRNRQEHCLPIAEYDTHDEPHSNIEKRIIDIAQLHLHTHTPAHPIPPHIYTYTHTMCTTQREFILIYGNCRELADANRAKMYARLEHALHV